MFLCTLTLLLGTRNYVIAPGVEFPKPFLKLTYFLELFWLCSFNSKNINFSQIMTSNSYFSRNRLKLKHETKLQKEFFEKKRHFRNSNSSTVKRVSKATAQASQDLLSLEVIMVAHREKKQQKKDKRGHTSQTIGYTSLKKSSQASCSRESSLKQPQHIFPELSPIRPKIAAVNLEKDGQGIHLHSELEDQEFVFSRRPLPALCTDGCYSQSDRQIITDHEKP